MIELGTLLAGPFTGRLLGDLGAEIVKVEDPAGPTRSASGARRGTRDARSGGPSSRATRSASRSNLRTERGQELLLELVRHADVVTENFRPGTLERWNIGFEQMQAVNRGIVLARVSGYGQTGPYAERGGLRVRRRGDGRDSATSTASRASRRRASTSRSATRSRGCSPRRESSPRSTGATRPAAGRARSSTCRCSRRPSRMLESTVPGVRPARASCAGPGGTGLEGRRAVEHLQVARRQVDGDRGQRRQRLPPALRGDGTAGAGRRRALRDAPRARRPTRRRSRASSPSGPAATTRPRSTASSTRRA